MTPLYFFIKKLSRYRRELTIGILLSIALALSSIALLSLSGWFISASAFAGLAAISAMNFNYFIPASMIRLLAFIRILSRYFDRVINHDFTFRILSDLRVWLYEAIVPLAPGHLLMHRSGDLLNRIVNDIDTLDHLYLNVLSPVFVAIVVTILSSIFVGYFSLQLGLLVFILFCVALLIIPAVIYHPSKIIGRDIQAGMAALRIQTVDFLQGFVDLLLFVKKENRALPILSQQNFLIRAQKKLAHLKGFVLSMMQLLTGLSVALIFLCGIPLVNHQVISGAQLAMIVLLVIAAFEQFTALPLAFLSLGKTQHAAERLLVIAHEKPTVAFVQSDLVIKQYDIQFNHVSFAYPNSSKIVLKDYSLTIPEKTHLAITGPSGSGKTTIASLLARIWDPQMGEISIGGISLTQFSESKLREMVSLVTQHVHIFNASVRDNMTLMQSDITDDALFSVLEKVNLADHVRALPDGLNTMMGEFGKNFSGGQIRRIAIARALLRNTPILILDEPSTGLGDELMTDIWKNCASDFKNKTVIVITHDLNAQLPGSRCEVL